MAENNSTEQSPQMTNDIITLKGKQFGRYVEVEVRDFSTATKLIISNDFEIEFEFFKTIDETKQASVGKIVIYGLDTKTVESLQHEGGEVTLRCGYEQLQIITLFTAYITRFYTERANNTTVTTIECSANILDFYYTGGQYLGGKPNDRATTTDSKRATGSQIDSSLYESVKYYTPPGWESVFDLGNVPSDAVPSFENYIKTLSTNTDFKNETYDNIFRLLCDYASMECHKDDASKTVVFSFTDIGIMRAMQDIETNDYPKVSPDKMRYLADKSVFESSYKTNTTSEKMAVVLDKMTGLISTRTEYKIATAYADQQRSPNESETIESMRSRNDKAVKKANAEAERKRKAEEKGKEYKKKPEKYSRQKIRVNRLYQRITALLNPNVKPQTIVIVRNEVRGIFDKLRVREATFRGNNRRNDWVMELYCEDTQGTYDADLTAAQVAQIESEYSDGMATQGVVGGNFSTTTAVDGNGNRITLAKVTTKSGKSAQVDARYAPQFQGFINDLEATGYQIDSLGGFNVRKNANNSNVLSVHSFGQAIDINPSRNPNIRGVSKDMRQANRWRYTDLPVETSALAKKWGLGWGFEWNTISDAMHFSVAKNEGGKPL